MLHKLQRTAIRGAKDKRPGAGKAAEGGYGGLLYETGNEQPAQDDIQEKMDNLIQVVNFNFGDLPARQDADN